MRSLFIFTQVILFALNIYSQDLHPNRINGQGTPSPPLTDFISPVSNQIDWTVAGVEGGIPTYMNIIDVTTLGVEGDGITDNHLTVQNAIENATQGTALFFPEGIYLFNSTLVMKDSIVLRGACSHKTTLRFDLNSTANPSVWFKSTNITGTTAIIAGYEKGSTTISVKDPSLFNVGQYVEIIQDNDSSKMYTKEIWNTGWAQNSVGQLIQVTAVNGNKVSLKRPLYYDFSSDLNVRARGAIMITGAGLENLKVFRVDDGDNFSLRFSFAANCWIRNIEGEYCDSGHIGIQQSANIEVRDSYFHHAYNYGGGGHGYGINLGNHPTDCLIENNIFHYLRHAFLAQVGAIGNVFAYNYSRNPNGNPNDIAMHGHYGLMNLLEGNIVQKMIAGDWWGPSGPGNTYFRNRIETSNIIMQDHTHSQNIIGNEILNGTVNISSSSNYTWQHSNFNVTGLIDKEYDGIVPNSLYLSEKPDFFKTLPWPAIGPEFSLGQNTIPAKARWDDGTELVPCLNSGGLDH